MKGTRVRLIMLETEDLLMLLEDPEELESKLGYKIFIHKDKHLNEAIETKLKMINKRPKQIEWYTYYGIYHLELGIMIGLIGFKDVPDELGESEIGYGIAPSFEGKGFATEALKLLSDKGFKNKELSQIIAKTSITNYPSQRVLIKNGFKKITENDMQIRWGLRNTCSMGGE